jgi:hypothetical protein
MVFQLGAPGVIATHIETVYNTGITKSSDSQTSALYVSGNEVITSEPDETPWIPGEFKITPLTKSMKQWLTATGACGIHRQTTTASYYYTMTGPMLAKSAGTYFLDLSSSFPDDRDRALVKAHAKIAKNELDLATELGEIRETVQFLMHPYREIGLQFDRMLRGFSRFARGTNLYGKRKKAPPPFWQMDLKDVDRFVDTVLSSWMETRFALMPLVRSFAATLEALDKRVEAFDAQKLHVARSSIKRVMNSEKSVQSGVSYCVYTAKGTCDLRQRTKACVFYRLTKPLSKLAQFGLSKSDIAVAVWELTRLSFVVDRFILIGDWLQALLPEPEVEILGNTVSVKREVDARVVATPRMPVGYYVDYWQVGGSRYIEESYNREINKELPQLPVLSDMRTLKNWKHIVDHLAISKQVFNNLKRR